MVAPRALLLQLAALGAARAKPLLSWVSQPVLPGETVVLQGSGLTQDTEVLLKPLAGGKEISLRPEPQGVSGDGAVLRFVLPGPLAAYEVVARDGSGSSNAKELNVPDIHWAHGDAHDSCTPGGFLRVFGKALHFPADADDAAALAAGQRRLDELVESAADEEQLRAAAVALARLKRQVREPAVPILKLEGSRGKTLQLTAERAPLSGYQALFRLPEDLEPDSYNVSMANALAPEHFSLMMTFIEPAQPLVTSVTVKAKEEWATRRFNVKSYDKSIGSLPRNGEKDWKDASPALEKALADAAKAGGGVVYFPRGQYFLNKSSGFTIPWGVKLLGESRETVALYMAGCDMKTAPLAYFRSPGTVNIDPKPQKAGKGRWAIEELTVYVTGFHNYIFFVNNYTIGWRMHRCRVLANAYFGSNGPFTAREKFWFNYTLQQPGDVVGLNNARNWEITNNEIYGTNGGINSQISSIVCEKSSFNGCHGASWGRLAENEIVAGGTTHFMNQWRQVIVEKNAMSGNSPIAYGNSVGTGPGGGFDQNLYHGENSIRWVHGNDREIVTFDNAGGAYFGTLAEVKGTTLTFAYDAKSCGTLQWGGWDGAVIVVLNGTGVGQWRRIVRAGIGSEASNPKNRTWTIDRPFDIVPGLRDSVVQVVPFRGRIVFHGDRFMDGGTVQFYGQAIDVSLVSCVTERISGYMAWGQWRGCSLFQYCPNSSSPSGLGSSVRGTFGNGVMPDLQIQYINDTVVEGNKVDRYSAFEEPLGLGFGLGKFLGGASFAITSYRDLPENIFLAMNVLYRRNRVLSNGGFNFGWIYGEGEGIRDILVEGNVVEKSDPDTALVVGKHAKNVFVRNNKLPGRDELAV